jgi:hypothetical protein
MKKNIMIRAFEALDNELGAKAEILIGGGAAMLLGHNIPLTTMDIDGLLMKSSVTPAELDPLIKKIGHDLKIGAHWFNDYINTFTYTVPKDFRSRLVTVFSGKNLTVFALGKEDLLIMKCFSGREKDIGHARALLKKGADIKIAETHIEQLQKKGLPRAKEAMDFLKDIQDSAGET